MKRKNIKDVKFKMWRDSAEKITGFEILQLGIGAFNLWSFYVLIALRYMLTNMETELALSKTYRFFEYSVGWYVNGVTLLLTYALCSAVFVFSTYNYILKKLKKAKGFFNKPSDRYLALMMALSIINVLMCILLLF